MDFSRRRHAVGSVMMLLMHDGGFASTGMMCDADDDVWRGEVCHMTRAKNAPSNV